MAFCETKPILMSLCGINDLRRDFGTKWEGEIGFAERTQPLWELLWNEADFGAITPEEVAKVEFRNEVVGRDVFCETNPTAAGSVLAKRTQSPLDRFCETNPFGIKRRPALMLNLFNYVKELYGGFDAAY